MKKIYVVMFLLLTILTFAAFTVQSNDDADKELIAAISGNDLVGLHSAISRGANVNLKNGNDATPLMFTVIESNLAFAKILLEEGADIDAVSKFKQTALMMAVAYRHNDIAKLLLKRGADPTIKDEDGADAMSFAQLVNNVDAVVLLKKYLRK